MFYRRGDSAQLCQRDYHRSSRESNVFPPPQSYPQTLSPWFTASKGQYYTTNANDEYSSSWKSKLVSLWHSNSIEYLLLSVAVLPREYPPKNKYMSRWVRRRARLDNSTREIQNSFDGTQLARSYTVSRPGSRQALPGGSSGSSGLARLPGNLDPTNHRRRERYELLETLPGTPALKFSSPPGISELSSYCPLSSAFTRVINVSCFSYYLWKSYSLSVIFHSFDGLLLNNLRSAGRTPISYLSIIRYLDYNNLRYLWRSLER